MSAVGRRHFQGVASAPHPRLGFFLRRKGGPTTVARTTATSLSLTVRGRPTTAILSSHTVLNVTAGGEVDDV